jgi:hypothetical protein
MQLARDQMAFALDVLAGANAVNSRLSDNRARPADGATFGFDVGPAVRRPSG